MKKSHTVQTPTRSRRAEVNCRLISRAPVTYPNKFHLKAAFSRTNRGLKHTNDARQSLPCGPRTISLQIDREEYV